MAQGWGIESKNGSWEPIEFGKYYVKITEKQKRYLKVRGVVERLLAVLALIVLSPLFLVVSIAQKISAPNESVFFLQKRVGKDAHCFYIIKFRTMKSFAPPNVATGELEHPEHYISKLGSFLRNTSIDELPQLINVVRGEMGLIGPRPLVYTERQIRFLRRWYGIYQVKPGITGWAQVNGRDTVDIYDKVFYDREYIQKVGLLFDIKVIVKSIAVVLGHYGIIDGKIDPQIRRESVVLMHESKIKNRMEHTEINKQEENCETQII